MWLWRRGAFALTLSAALMVGAGGTRAAESASHDLSGVWWIENYDGFLKPADGSKVPFTAEALASYQKNQSLQAQGQLADRAISRCLPAGLPRAMLSGYPLKIIQHDRSVTFLHEQNHTFWHAVVGVEHTWTDNDESAFMGADTVAHWEGDTLVTDSIGFKPKSYLDEYGMPHTDQLHIVQRLRKIKQGKELEALMTIEDPATFTKAWTARRTYEWRPDIKLMEYVCGEPQRALTGDRAKALHLNWKTP